MKRQFNRRGSALLIVLGLMAFILISAVAFSAYMRQARLPSSYLRRSSASRMLAKAALAEAIDRIDAAIGNNPHPGLGDAHYRYPRLAGDYGEYNNWVEHVFVGTNSGNFVSTEETVSTLTLEGLAYIPPPLINEARYYSRRATSARWRDLGFDSGRYAFCAIDVSDCLDVNRVTAGSGFSGGSERDIPAGRNSSDTGRLTLGYAFEDQNHTGYTVQPSAWDKFMDNFLTEDGRANSTKVPLVSVADMNLAIWKEKPAGVISPFCRFIEGGTAFVTAETGPEAELLRNMAFVTDSYMPRTNLLNVARMFNLENPRDQPFFGFPPDKADRNDATVDQIAQFNNDFLNHYSDKLLMPETVQLYDYLDLDSVPTSLAMPTVERTPMITGVTLEGSLNIVASLSSEPEDAKLSADGNTRYLIKNATFKIVGDLTAMAGLVFPFKYEHGSAPSFKVQAAASISLVPVGEERALRRGSGAWPAVFARGNWQNSKTQPQPEGFPGKLPSSVVMASQQTSAGTVPTRLLDEESAVLEDVQMPFGAVNVSLGKDLPASEKFTECKGCAWRMSQKQVKKVDENGNETWENKDDPVYEFGMYPTRADLGGPVEIASPSDAKYVPSVQVWVRVVNADGRTVDLVPACVNDDESPSELLRTARGSNERPVLRFCDKTSSSSEIAFSEASFKSYGTKTVDIWPKGYLADDPRFNYAPENFIALDTVAGGTLKQMWKDKNRSADSDGDIFMAVSDAGYLQSVFEFANLLYQTDLTGTGNGWGSMNDSGYNGAMRISDRFQGAGLPADKSMWTTYSQYAGGGRRVDIAGVFKEVKDGSKGYRMTPYTSSIDNMAAVLANTPLDWWAASTNDAQGVSGANAQPQIVAKQRQLNSLSDAVKYTFSEHSGAQAKLKHGDVKELASRLKGSLRSLQYGSWEAAFDGMDWEGADFDYLFGYQLQNSNIDLHSVDRKFLHGFWRGCFAARQQLFLVFVRAEPLMMGGGAKGMTPPQLGARAVALVWRDPSPTRADAGNSQPRPHRTRVLFYRQFD